MAVRTFGPYEIKETLGTGGYSKVKLGVHSETGQKVALKILKKDELASSSSTLRQVQREIAAMSKLNHSNVLKMIEVHWDAEYPKKNGTTAHVIIVVLELATGGELFDFLSYTGCFEESIARSYFHQLVAGVACCHENGVVHRDLKPENLLLSSDFVLKIADFGFSALYDPEGTLRTECGTRGYMAPEVFRGQGYDGSAADIFSCGVILFICLAGFPPFQSAIQTDWWFHKLLTNNHALFWEAHCRTAFFSTGAKDMINKLLEPDAEKRITIDGIKQHPWFNGPTINPAALAGELRRRKEFVDSEKRREKAAEAAKRAAANEAKNARIMAQGFAVDRGVDMFDMPPCPPGFEDGAMPFRAPERFVADRGTTVYTSFRTAQPASEIISTLDAALSAMYARVSINEENFKVKASVMTPSAGTIELVAQVYQDAEDETMNVVEIKRRQGDAWEFRKLFGKLQAEITGEAFQDKSPSLNLTAEEKQEELDLNS